MTGIRHTDVRGISSGNPVYPQSPTVTAPVGLRLRFATPAPPLLRFPSGNLTDAPVRP